MRAIWSISLPMAFRVVQFTLGVTLFFFIIESVKRGPVRRHWPFMVAVAALLLVYSVPPFVHSEVARAAVPLGCMVLMAVQWLTYRKAVSGTHLAFLSFVVAGFGLANLWLAEMSTFLHTRAYDLTRVQILILRTHGALAWTIGALGVVVSIWGLFTFARWGGKRVTDRWPRQRSR